MYKNNTNFLGSLSGFLNRLQFIKAIVGIDDAEMKKWIMRIQITTLLLIMGLMQVGATTFAQRLTLKQNNIPLEKIFIEIRKQTGYDIFFEAQKLSTSKRVSIDFYNAPLEQVMSDILRNSALAYSIENKTIVITEKKKGFIDKILSVFNKLEIRGFVLDEKNNMKAGVTIKVKETGKTVHTDNFGQFVLKDVDENSTIIFSHIGYKSEEFKATADLKVVRLKLSESPLDEVQVMAYGQTSRRKATGNITKVTGDDIRSAPISNPLLALEGMVPGMTVSQGSGLPGSAVNIQVRGRTRVDRTNGADDSPLIIVNGVPITVPAANLNTMLSNLYPGTTEGISPFISLSAGDIESIEVLKDADATAIYGSRGANGVILITTKKGKSGPTTFNASLTSGINKSQLQEVLSLQEYLDMRKEAFRNSGDQMNNTNAYDLLLWDTTRNSNLPKTLLGRTASYSNFQVAVSGGTEQASFNVSGTHRRETTAYNSPMPNTLSNVHVGISTKSLNKKFTADFSGDYALNQVKSGSATVADKMFLAPHQKLYNDDGSLAWRDNGITLANPLAILNRTYGSDMTTVNARAMLSYKFTDELTLSTSTGYNISKSEELGNTPTTASDPALLTKAQSRFGFLESNNWIVEPQIEFKKMISKGRLTLLAGATIQTEKGKNRGFSVRDYSSDEYLGTLIGASTASFNAAVTGSREYKYNAGFARATYDYDDKYILNISARRDGSSRFGPNYRYSNFGAMGAAWIFSNEAFLNNKIISFGKLRASYGTTGNDKIGDYKFLGLYGQTLFPYGYLDSTGLVPAALSKPDLHWELNRKFELGLDLGFFNDRLLFSAAAYIHRSKDPLVQMPLSGVTGFAMVVSNLEDVIVQNRGLELNVDFNAFTKKDFTWKTSVNITFPENKLIAYPGLENSPYFADYVIGKNLSLISTLTALGVDTKTGLYRYEDINGDGKITNLTTALGGDRRNQFDSEAEFYGGMQNRFRYKRISLDIFMSFTKGWGPNLLSQMGGNIGSVATGNVNRYALNRWQKEGDIAVVQKFSTKVLENPDFIDNSDAAYSNVFFTRLQTMQLSYNIPSTFTKKIGLRNVTVHAQGQNLFAFAPFGGTNPRTLDRALLAPMRTYVAGLNLNF